VPKFFIPVHVLFKNPLKLDQVDVVKLETLLHVCERNEDMLLHIEVATLLIEVHVLPRKPVIPCQTEDVTFDMLPQV